MTEVGAKLAQVGHKVVQVGLKVAQVGPKRDQVGPRLVQDGPKLPPNWHRIRPKFVQDFINAYIPKIYKNQWKTLIFHISRASFGPEVAQVSAKLAEIGRR